MALFKAELYGIVQSLHLPSYQQKEKFTGQSPELEVKRAYLFSGTIFGSLHFSTLQFAV